LCQNKDEETLLRFKSSSSNTEIRTCIIPAHKDNKGNITYLGSPQCIYPEAGRSLDGKLFKDRNAYSHLPLNNVVVMREDLLYGFYSCMDSYDNYLRNNCSGNPTAGCLRSAEDYKKRVCHEFKERNFHRYLDIKL
jgi:hypothetical protein